MIIYLETANQRLSKNVKKYRVFENKILNKIFQQTLTQKNLKKISVKRIFLLKNFKSSTILFIKYIF